MKIIKLFSLSVCLLFVFASCSKTDSGGGTPTPTPVAEKSTPNVAYGTDPLQKMDIYLPANRTTASTKVMILIHGGGWTSGDKGDFAVMLDSLKKRLPDYAIFNLNYRLAIGTLPPTNVFPTQEMDIKAAVEFIYNNRANYLISDKYVMVGASAGGHLALLHAYKYATPVKVKAVVDFFGPTDMVDIYNNPGTVPQVVIAALMSGTPTSNPTLYQQSSPIANVSSTTPPTIVIQGGLDLLVNATRQSQALITKLTAFAVPNQYVFYPTGGHGDWDAGTYTDAFNKIQAFLGVHVQ